MPREQNPVKYTGEPTAEPSRETTSRDWTPGRVDAVISRADTGDFSGLADLARIVCTDPKVRGPMETRTGALLGAPLSFDFTHPKVRRTSPSIADSEPVQGLVNAGDWWQMCPETSLNWLMFWGLLLNCAPYEKVWHRRPFGKREWFLRIYPKHPRNLRWNPSNGKLTLMTAERHDGVLVPKELEINPGDGRWGIFSPFGEGPPWGDGLIWPLALAWLEKQFANFDWSRRNEARGRAALIGTTPPGALDADRKAFARDIAALRVRLGIAIPHGYDVKAVEFGNADHETFRSKVANADSSIAILILGQNSTTDQSTGGSYASGKSAERVRQDYLERDAEVMATHLGEHFLADYLRERFNVVDRVLYPVWDTRPTEAISASANVVARAAEALDKLLRNNVQVDVDAFALKYGIPLRKG